MNLGGDSKILKRNELYKNVMLLHQKRRFAENVGMNRLREKLLLRDTKSSIIEILKNGTIKISHVLDF